MLPYRRGNEINKYRKCLRSLKSFRIPSKSLVFHLLKRLKQYTVYRRHGTNIYTHTITEQTPGELTCFVARYLQCASRGWHLCGLSSDSIFLRRVRVGIRYVKHQGHWHILKGTPKSKTIQGFDLDRVREALG